MSFGAVTAFTENIVTEQQSDLSKRQEGNIIEVNAAGTLEKGGHDHENELVKRGKGKKRKGEKRRIRRLRQRLAKLG